MKKLLITLSALVCAVCFSANAYAALLSPGISVLQSNVKMEKGGVAGNTVTFSAKDFEALLGTSTVGSVKITSLPDENAGTLMLGKTPVSVGLVIPSHELDALCFVPSGQGAEASFGFIPAGSDYEKDFVCVISMDSTLDLAPVTHHSEINDMAGITVFSVLSGEDGEDGVLRFSVVSGASHGTVEITDEQTGAYRYTPDGGYSGKDSFTFCAYDEAGNVSNISTVTVNVARNGKNIVYSDMEDSPLHLAAAALYDKDIMLGDGGTRTFSPEGKVSRSDFLIMAMNAAGISAKEAETDFADEASFAPYERKYISAAQSLGIVIGSDTDAGRCFLPDADITDGEAALIICRIAALEGLDIVDSDIAVSVMAHEDYDALAVLAEADIFESDIPAQALSRGDAAQILYSLMCRCE